MSKTGVCYVAFFVSVAALAGCATHQAGPAVATDVTLTPTHGQFVWYDLLTEDVDGVKTFYSELLGWSYEDTSDPDYFLIKHRGRPIGGIVDMKAVEPDSNQSQWISMLSVADVAQAVQMTEQAGGETHLEPTEIEGMGTIAVVSDPQGAVVSFLRTEAGYPDKKPWRGDWMWTELWTGDVAASSQFYGDLVGFDIKKKVILEDTEYVYFARDDKPRAGVIPRPEDVIRAHWLPYVRVEDPAALADRVEGLGGTVLLEPREDIRQGTVAIILDPSGAAVALQHWEG